MGLSNIVTLLVLCAILSITFGGVTQGTYQEGQTESYQNLGRVRRQAFDDDLEAGLEVEEQDILQEENQAALDDQAEEAEEEQDASEDEAVQAEEQNNQEQEEADEQIINEEIEVVDSENDLNEVAEDQKDQTASPQKQDNVDQTTEAPQIEQAQDKDGENSYEDGAVIGWTTCDFWSIPRKSCHDCNTRMFCKRVGGLLKPCMNPLRPYCNIGICSPIPSASCA